MNRTYTSNNRSGSAKRRYRATTTIALAGVSLLAFMGIQAAGQQETGAATQTTVNANGNVAVDEAGNLYVVSGNSVLKMNPDGTNQHTIASGFNFYVYASVAAAGGQVFVSDWSNNQVIAMGSEGTNPHTIATGLCYPQGIAADSTGHVFVAEPLPCDGNGYGGVIVMNADGTNQHAIGTGLNGPYGVAVDSGGHVYVADYDFQKIDVMNSDGTNEHTIASVFANSWFNSPRSVAVDSAGHVFVGSEYNDFVVEMNSDGTNQTRIGSSGTENLSGALAADATGHVYVASFTSPSIVKLSFGVADTTLPDATRGLAYAPVALKADLPLRHHAQVGQGHPASAEHHRHRSSRSDDGTPQRDEVVFGWHLVRHAEQDPAAWHLRRDRCRNPDRQHGQQQGTSGQDQDHGQRHHPNHYRLINRNDRSDQPLAPAGGSSRAWSLR